MSFYLIAIHLFACRVLMIFDWWQMVTTFREIRWHWRQIGLRPDVYHQIHANHYVELEMAME